MPHRRSFSRGEGRKIDFKSWDSIPGLSTSISTDSTVLAGGLAFTIPATILRWRGSVMAWLDASDKQVGDAGDLAFGLAIISSDAFAAGAGSVPDPISEPEYPWIWLGTMDIRVELTAATEAWGISAQRVDVDSKAMRKVKPGETACMIIQAAGVTGAPNINVEVAQTRVLIGT